jgi:hypothetical protein
MSSKKRPNLPKQSPTGKLSAEGVAKQIRACHGNLAAVARHFHCSRVSVHAFIQRRPSLLRIYQEVRETFLDHAESALQAAVMGGEAWAVTFALKYLGHSRGYVERSEALLLNRIAQLEARLQELLNLEDQGEPANKPLALPAPEAKPGNVA